MSDYSFDLSKHRLGKLCKQNHEYLDTGKSLRKINGGGCIICSRIQYKKWREANVEKAREATAKWVENNRDKRNALHSKYYHNPKNNERIKTRQREYAQLEERKQKHKVIRVNHRARKYNPSSIDLTEADFYKVLNAFRGLCAYCQSNQADTIDHVIALSQNGSHALHNLLPCCYSCNASKQEFLVYDWYKSKSFFSPQHWQEINDYLSKVEQNVIGGID